MSSTIRETRRTRCEREGSLEEETMKTNRSTERRPTTTRHSPTLRPPASTRPELLSACLMGLLLALLPGSAASDSVDDLGITAEEIVRRLEQNEVQHTSRGSMAMTITDRFGERTVTMDVYSRGTDDALVEFTSAAERGQKVLRTQDEIYLFYPDAAELIRLQGAALRESMLGSDVSYEDLTGGKTLLETYRVALTGEETVDGRPCYVVTFEARGRDVAYPRQTMWIDEELFVVRRGEQFSLNGRLLKTTEFRDVREIDGYQVTMRAVISDALKRNSSTEMVVREIEFDVPLRDDLFSLEELSW